MLLPLLAGWGCYDLAQNYNGPVDLQRMLRGWLGLIPLGCLLAACAVPWLSRVFRFLPPENRLVVLALRAAYIGFVPHAMWLVLDEWHIGGIFAELSRSQYVTLFCGVAAVVFGIAAFVRWKMKPNAVHIARFAIFVAAALALFHGRAIFTRAEFQNETLPAAFVPYLWPFALGAFVLLLLAARKDIHFRSPVPRFSLLTLMLLVSAGFSYFALEKHWLPWSFHRSMYEVPEIKNQWGAYRQTIQALSPEGSVAFTNAKDGPKRLWNCDLGCELMQLNQSENLARYARFSPDSKTLAVVTLESVDVAQEHPQAPARLLKIRSKTITFTLPLSTVLWLYDVPSGRLLAAVLGPDRERMFAFSADSQRLLVFSMENGAYVYETRTGTLLGHRYHGGNHWQLSLLDRAREDDTEQPRLMLPVKSRGGYRFLSAGDIDPVFREFHVEAPAIESLCRAVERSATDYCLSHAGALLLSRGDRTLQALDLRTGTELFTRNEPMHARELHGQLYRSALSLDEWTRDSMPETADDYTSQGEWENALLEDRPLVISTDREVAVLDSESRILTPILKDRFRDGFVHALSHDGSTLLMSSEQGTVRLWKRRHPPQWWGVATVPLFWIALALTGGLLWSLVRDYRTAN